MVNLISAQVYNSEQRLADCRKALATAQQEAAATPSAENTAKVTAAQTAVDRAQKKFEKRHVLLLEELTYRIHSQ